MDAAEDDPKGSDRNFHRLRNVTREINSYFDHFVFSAHAFMKEEYSVSRNFPVVDKKNYVRKWFAQKIFSTDE